MKVKKLYLGFYKVYFALYQYFFFSCLKKLLPISKKKKQVSEYVTLTQFGKKKKKEYIPNHNSQWKSSPDARNHYQWAGAG